MESTVTLVDGMAFDVGLEGHHFPIDAKAEHGGQDRGPSPKPLLLSALGGCAAMDVVSILRKMRQPLETLAVNVASEITTTEHPMVFDDFYVTVTLTGDVDPKKAWRAVALSRDRYCGVAAMLRSHAPVHYRLVLNGEDVPEPL